MNAEPPALRKKKLPAAAPGETPAAGSLTMLYLMEHDLFRKTAIHFSLATNAKGVCAKIML
jgi:hypothetical protein